MSINEKEEKHSVNESKYGKVVINNGSKMLKPSEKNKNTNQLLSGLNWNKLDPAFFESKRKQ